MIGVFWSKIAEAGAGDVVLKDLDIKASALDDLDLPIKLKYGYLGELKLQIPWKNLYTAPTIATVSSLHILAVPNKGVQFNAEKEAKNAADVKARELAALEAARTARRKVTPLPSRISPPSPGLDLEAAAGKKDEEADGFAEKMVTQVIKNLQVTISDIHIRFEVLVPLARMNWLIHIIS